MFRTVVERFSDESTYVRNHPKIKPLIAQLLSHVQITERTDWFEKQIGWKYGLRNHPTESIFKFPGQSTPKGTVYERNELGWNVTDNVIDCLGSTQNYKASIEEIEAGLTKILKLLTHKRFLGPFTSREQAQTFFGDQQIRIWPIFYKKEGEKYRLLVNLSFDKNGPSFNDNIAEFEKTVHYLMTKAIILWIVVCDIQWLWAVDAWMAYYSVPIAHRFTPSVGFKICGVFFFFITLTMGMASAPRIYTEFADMITWIIVHNYELLFTCIISGVKHTLLHHYVDDWIGGTPEKDIKFAELQLEKTLWWKARLGVPTQPKKVTYPAKAIQFIGYIFCLSFMCLRITFKRLAKYRTSLSELIHLCKTDAPIALGALQSVNGQLRSIQLVYPHIVPFLRASEEVANVPSKVINGKWTPAVKWLKSTPEMCKDLLAVQKALNIKSDNIRSFSDILCTAASCTVTIYTDASTGVGVGGYIHENHGAHFANIWSDFDIYNNFPKKPDITFLELLGVVTAAITFKEKLRGKKVLFYCDNMPSVWICIKKSACFKRPDLTALVKVLLSVAHECQFRVYLKHVEGIRNPIADKLSRQLIIVGLWIDKSKGLRLNKRGIDTFAIVRRLLGEFRLFLAYKPLYDINGFQSKCNCKNEDQCTKCQYGFVDPETL